MPGTSKQKPRFFQPREIRQPGRQGGVRRSINGPTGLNTVSPVSRPYDKELIHRRRSRHHCHLRRQWKETHLV